MVVLGQNARIGICHAVLPDAGQLQAAAAVFFAAICFKPPVIRFYPVKVIAAIPGVGKDARVVGCDAGFSVSAIGIRLGTIKVHWKWFAVTCGLIILPLTLLFFGGADLPSGDKLTRVLPLLPFAVLGAALNAFNEEMQFRAPFLNLLRNQFGSGQAILLTSVLFGMMHYIGGSPAGLPGFLITFALGALFAKAELETQGLYAGWLIHFCQNVVIYSFWALGAV